ncbi:MAG: O-antigen ligase family protein [Candidatus Dormibacteraeota bacterium]|nr:O-antigen ligase family protein [Candidatus Dormibacteraeota bacterium]
MPPISRRANSQAPSPAGLVALLPAAYALLLPVLFLPFLVDAFVLPRTLLTVLAGGTLFALGLLRGRFALGPLGLPALAVATAAILACAFSVAPALSLAGDYSWYDSMPVRLAYLGLFIGAAWLGSRRLVAEFFVVGCALAGLEALLEWPPGPLHLARPDGNLGQAGLLGALLAMALPLALELGARRPRWLLALAPIGLGLLASGSRSGWLAALAGAGILLVFRVRRRPVLALGATLGTIGLAAVLGLLLRPLRELNGDTGSGRPAVWRDALPMIAARPLTGWGEDTFGTVFGRYQTGDWAQGQPFARAHSMPLDLAAGQGLLGVGACAWFFITFWRGIWRQPELGGLAGACAAYLVWSLLNFDWAPATGAFWLLAGTAWSAVAPARRTLPGAAPSAALRRGAVAGVAMLLVGVLAALAADAAYRGGNATLGARLNPLQPRYAAATGSLAGLRRATDLRDPDPATYVALGDLLQRSGHSAPARAAWEEALAVFPYDRAARRRLARGP